MSNQVRKHDEIARGRLAMVGPQFAPAALGRRVLSNALVRHGDMRLQVGGDGSATRSPW